MNKKNYLVSAGLAVTLFIGGASGAYAATLNNMITVTDSNGVTVMNWQKDLSAMGTVTTDARGVTSFMGSESVVMSNGQNLWDYNWTVMADPDPFIDANFGIVNTSMSDQTFDLVFSLPISPSFTNGTMTGSLSASFSDNDNDGSASLAINGWDGLIDGTSYMSLFTFNGSCTGTGCSSVIAPVSQGPLSYLGDVNNNIGIHLVFTLSAGDSASFDSRFEVNPVPVPAAVWLFGSGILALAGAARRKKRV